MKLIALALFFAATPLLHADSYNFGFIYHDGYGAAINDSGSFAVNTIFGIPDGCYGGAGPGSAQCAVGFVSNYATGVTTFYPDQIVALSNNGTVVTTSSIYSAGVAQPLPASLNAAGINDYGELVGSVNGTTQGTQLGAQYINGELTTFTIPGSDSTWASGVNDSGQIVGSSDNAAVTKYLQVDGFLETNGVFTTLDYPGAYQTYATAINNNGVVAGYYLESPDAAYSSSYMQAQPFTYSNGVFHSVDLLNAGTNPLPNYVYGINDAGTLIGTQTNGSLVQTNAFLATPLSQVPEIDANSGASAVALLGGVLLIMRGRAQSRRQ